MNKNLTASIRPGWAGHDREICVNIGSDDYGEDINWADALEITEALPETWMIENRGTRLEVHPTGHFARGYTDEDVALLDETLQGLGYRTKVIEA